MLPPYLASVLTPTRVPMYLLLNEGAMLPRLCILCGKKGRHLTSLAYVNMHHPVWSRMVYRLSFMCCGSW